MSVQHCCDRCGAEMEPRDIVSATTHMSAFHLTDVQPWNERSKPMDIRIAVQFYAPHLDGDGGYPDLCLGCKDALLAIAFGWGPK